MKVPRWSPADPAAITARRAWAKAMVAHITDPTSNPTRPPAYGSPHWAALADDDPRKLAAAVIAAECWATDLDDLPNRLAAELNAHRAAEQTAWDQWRNDHTTEHAAIARQTVRSLLDPSIRELGRRLSMTEPERTADAHRPRPSDRRPANPTDRSRDQHHNAAQDGEAAA